MSTVYAITSQRAAEKEARKLTRATGQKHVVRPYALGNKVAYQVVNIGRFGA